MARAEIAMTRALFQFKSAFSGLPIYDLFLDLFLVGLLPERAKPLNAALRQLPST